MLDTGSGTCSLLCSKFVANRAQRTKWLIGLSALGSRQSQHQKLFFTKFFPSFLVSSRPERSVVVDSLSIFGQNRGKFVVPLLSLLYFNLGVENEYLTENGTAADILIKIKAMHYGLSVNIGNKLTWWGEQFLESWANPKIVEAMQVILLEMTALHRYVICASPHQGSQYFCKNSSHTHFWASQLCLFWGRVFKRHPKGPQAQEMSFADPPKPGNGEGHSFTLILHKTNKKSLVSSVFQTLSYLVRRVCVFSAYKIWGGIVYMWENG